MFVGKIEQAFTQHLLPGTRHRRFFPIVGYGRFREKPALESRLAGLIAEIHIFQIHEDVLVKPPDLFKDPTANAHVGARNPVHPVWPVIAHPVLVRKAPEYRPGRRNIFKQTIETQAE